METPTNSPDIWQHLLPWPESDAHKYRRGHAVIFASGELTGATRLATTACSRIGAGLVTVISQDKADHFRTVLPPDIMVRENLTASVRNVTCALAGPGGSSLADGVPRTAFRVLDAGALPQADEALSFDARHVLTPHEGEFANSFPQFSGDRVSRARAAATSTGAFIVLKGDRTVIAAPDGRTIINDHGSPFLAKAGTGDVLAGIIAGLLAQLRAKTDSALDRLPVMEMLAAAVWIHGEAGRRIGPGLVAGDLETVLPPILSKLYSGSR